jgi:hypothetical protein
LKWSEVKKAAVKIALNPPTSQLRKPEHLKHDRCIATYKEIKEFVAELQKKPGVVKFDTVKDKSGYATAHRLRPCLQRSSNYKRF